MIDEPRIVQTAVQRAAVLHLTVSREEMPKLMGPSVGEIVAVLAAQGLIPAGAMFTHHSRRPTDTFDFDLGFPVDATVGASGRVQPGQLPATMVARTVYQGPYEGLAAAWGELHAWIAAEGHEPAPNLWECYLAGPESSSDSATWRTELNRPLVRA